MKPVSKRQLRGVNLGRGLAATTVLLYHVAHHLDKVDGVVRFAPAVQFGHAGVDLFFVTSGFIILFVHYDDIGAPDRLRSYASRRLSRIMPLYWVASVLSLVMSIGGGHKMPSVGDFLWSMSLLDPNPLLGVAWTLHFEMVFYAAFCVLILNRRIGIGLLIAWLTSIVLARVWSNVDHAGSLTDGYNLEFFMGMAVAWWLQRRPVRRPRAVLAAGLIMFAISAFMENAGILDGYSDWARGAYGLPSAVILLGVVDAERRGLLAVPRGILLLLGSASYSIYLFQYIFIGMIWRSWVEAGMVAFIPLWARFSVLAIGGLAGGILVSRLVEYPLLRLIRSLRRPLPASCRASALPQSAIRRRPAHG